MYRDYPGVFDCPDDSAIVWRYMQLDRFLCMLKEGKLYFSRLPEFEGDPYEGTLPKVNADRVEELLKAAYGLAAGVAAVSCWHMNDVESVAMWKLYVHGPDGVAIQSRVGKLKGLNERSDFVIGKVRYINYETDIQPQNSLACVSLQPYMALFQKRRSYKHEEEVRVVILNPADLPGKSHIPEDRLDSARGFAVPVTLADLIERIVVSPEYPRSSIGALQQAIGCAGLNIQIEESDLLAAPNTECATALRKLAQSVTPTSPEDLPPVARETAQKNLARSIGRAGSSTQPDGR